MMDAVTGAMLFASGGVFTLVVQVTSNWIHRPPMMMMPFFGDDDDDDDDGGHGGRERSLEQGA